MHHPSGKTLIDSANVIHDPKTLNRQNDCHVGSVIESGYGSQLITTIIKDDDPRTWRKRVSNDYCVLSTTVLLRDIHENQNMPLSGKVLQPQGHNAPLC